MSRSIDFKRSLTLLTMIIILFTVMGCNNCREVNRSAHPDAKCCSQYSNNNIYKEVCMANQCDGKPFLNVTTCESDAESYCQCADASIIDAAVKKVEACCGSLKTGDATKDGIEMAKCALKVKSTGYKACSN